MKIIDRFRYQSSIKLIKAKNNSHILRLSQITIDEGKNCIKILTQKKTRKKIVYKQIY